MKKLTSTFTNNMSYSDILPFELENTVFFDIETTGFSARSSHLYLIGLAYYMGENQFCSIQFLAEQKEDEPALLYEFFNFIKDYKNIVHFNGNGFDIPYLKEKCRQYNMLYHFDLLTGYDLYKEACRFKKLFQTPDLKQKTLETFLGSARKDEFSGKELINVYYSYEKEHKDSDKELLLLHNFEDVKGLTELLCLYAYSSACSKNIQFEHYILRNYKSYDGTMQKELVIRFLLPAPVPTPVSQVNDFSLLTFIGNIGTLSIKVRSGELKFFYPDYKNYYYLPKEDCAMHKSVAFYVDKNFRTQAKAANCYSKKTGCFLPEYEEVFFPYFKAEYQDKILYFEADDTFFSDSANLQKYLLHIIPEITCVF